MLDTRAEASTGNGLLFLTAHQNGRGAQCHDTGGLTAKQQFGKTASPMRSHHNEIAAFRLCCLQDAFGRVSIFDVQSCARLTQPFCGLMHDPKRSSRLPLQCTGHSQSSAQADASLSARAAKTKFQGSETVTAVAFAPSALASASPCVTALAAGSDPSVAMRMCLYTCATSEVWPQEWLSAYRSLLALIVWRRPFHIDLGQGLRCVEGRFTVHASAPVPSRSAPSASVGWAREHTSKSGALAEHRKAAIVWAQRPRWSCGLETMTQPDCRLVGERPADIASVGRGVGSSGEHRLASTDRNEDCEAAESLQRRAVT